MPRTPSPNRPVTIKDVAAEAGLSPSTVSKVLTGNAYAVSSSTRQQVHVAVKRLGYVPDSSARNLRNRSSGQVGIVLNELDSSGPSMALRISALQLSSQEIVQVSFDGAVLAGITHAIRRHKQSSLVVFPQPLHAEEDDLTRYLDRRVEGLMIRTDPRRPSRLLTELDPARVAMTALWTQDVPAGVGYADADHHGGGKQAAKHLLELGHRRIAFFGDGIGCGNTHFEARHRGFLEALSEAGVAGQSEHLRHASRLRDLLYAPEPITAAFTPTDLQAALLVQELAALEVRVPTDLSLVGFDDIFGSDFIAGGLTTIYHPVREMAEVAVDNLMALVRGERVAKCRTVLNTRLVVRNSTARVEIKG